ncbi:MAG: PrsW family intramembrane metalloprotease [Spirochaetota bacterium]
MDFLLKVVAFFIAVVPVALIAFYVRRRNIHKIYSDTSIFKVFALGMLIGFPIGFVEEFLAWVVGGYLESTAFYIYESYFIAGFVEETFKILAIAWIVYDRKDFNQRMDGIVFCVVAALGFSFHENLVYMFQYYPEHSFFIAIQRAILCTPGHALMTGIAGYFVAVAKYEGRAHRAYEDFYVIIGWISAIFLHGTWNFLLSQFGGLEMYEGGWVVYAQWLLLPIEFLILRHLINKSVVHDASRPGAVRVKKQAFTLRWMIIPPLEFAHRKLSKLAGTPLPEEVRHFDARAVVRPGVYINKGDIVLPRPSQRIAVTKRAFINRT